ncbi:rhomboid family intramembrane serine protease [Streptomyces sp. NPDC020096]
MNQHVMELYASAAVVISVGMKAMIALEPADGGQRCPASLVRVCWARRPPVTSMVLVVTVVMVVLQYAVPGLADHLMRRPGALADGQWWRVFTALFVQSSGAVQIAINLPSLLAVGTVANRVLGPWRWLAVYFASGLAAQYVSLASWSPHGGGCSLAICGLVGALAVICARWTGELPTAPQGLRWWALLFPAAGLLLCAIHNNHGVGIDVGSVLGLGIALAARPGTLQIG